jgi:prepilin-type N-terminal cleavage/methylation domain-containing protein
MRKTRTSRQLFTRCPRPHPNPLRAPTEGWSGEGTKTPHLSDQARRGFTLVEVLLVLSLLAFMAAMGYPTIQRSMASQRLKAAADSLRAQWVRARVAAIESGCVHVFRYSQDGSFAVERLITGDDTVEAPTDMPLDVSMDSPTGNPLVSRGQLPEGVQFDFSEVIMDARAANVGLADTSTLSMDGTDGQPVSFYPDGSSSSATVRLRNQYQRCIELSLRGLTGVVKVSDVFLADEASQGDATMPLGPPEALP